MATALSIQDAIESNFRVLFDANVLIDGYSQRSGGPVRDLIVRINPGQRFLTELVACEFLAPGVVPMQERKAREDWRKEMGIKYFEAISPHYIGSYVSLLSISRARGGPVDLSLTAHSIASGHKVVIATRDGDDFCWHGGVFVIREFLSDAACR